MIPPHGTRTRHLLAALLLVATAECGDGCRSHADRETASAQVTPSPADADEHRVTLEPDAATRAGVRTEVAQAAAGAAEIAALARVLDPLPLVEMLHARAAARAFATVARAESERVTRLNREGQNASTRDVETARASLDKATLDVADTTARLSLTWGPLADQGDALADDLVSGRAALVRIDLPAGVTVTPPPAAVTLATTTDPERQRVARIVGRAPTTDPALQGDAYFGLVLDDPPRPGAVLAATVPHAATAIAGVAVPVSAVVWIDGSAVVYAERAAGEFERRTVTLGPRHDDHWIVSAGLAAGDRVVIAGAARLLSSEIVGSGPAAD